MTYIDQFNFCLSVVRILKGIPEFFFIQKRKYFIIFLRNLIIFLFLQVCRFDIYQRTWENIENITNIRCDKEHLANSERQIEYAYGAFCLQFFISFSHFRNNNS